MAWEVPLSDPSSSRDPSRRSSDRDRRVLDALACRAAHDDPALAERMRTGGTPRRRPGAAVRLVVIALVAVVVTLLVIGAGAGLLVGLAAGTVTGGVIAALLVR